jgi:hypothetical protein
MGSLVRAPTHLRPFLARIPGRPPLRVEAKAPKSAARDIFARFGTDRRRSPEDVRGAGVVEAQKMDAPEQELASAGGEPRYTLNEVADMLEAEAQHSDAKIIASTERILHAGAMRRASLWLHSLRSGGATTETGENDGHPDC